MTQISAQSCTYHACELPLSIVQLPAILGVVSLEAIGKDILAVADGEGHYLQAVVHTTPPVGLLLVSEAEGAHVLGGWGGWGGWGVCVCVCACVCVGGYTLL